MGQGIRAFSKKTPSLQPRVQKAQDVLREASGSPSTHPELPMGRRGSRTRKPPLTNKDRHVGMDSDQGLVPGEADHRGAGLWGGQAAGRAEGPAEEGRASLRD